MSEIPSLPGKRLTEPSVNPQKEAVRGKELSEREIFSLISAFGNNESKALLLIAIKDGNIYSDKDLFERMISLQGKKPVWKMHKNVPFQYCKDSLAPIGRVAKEVLNGDLSTYGFMVTEYGKNFGVPFAGALLDWSLKHPNFSFYQMLGMTASRYSKEGQREDKKRAPETRLKILKAIVENGDKSLSVTQMANIVKENPHAVKKHISALAKSGVLSKKEKNAGEPRSLYIKAMFPEQGQEQYKHFKTLSEQVAAILRETSDYVSVDGVADIIIQRHKYQWSRQSLTSTINGILLHFEEKGYVLRKEFEKGFWSEVTVSPNQKDIITSMVNLVNSFKIGDASAIKAGKESAEKIISNPMLVASLMRKAKENSPFANKLKEEETVSSLTSLISEKPNISTVELWKKYGRLTPSRLRTILSKCEQKGIFTSENTKFGKTWKVK